MTQATDSVTNLPQIMSNLPHEIKTAIFTHVLRDAYHKHKCPGTPKPSYPTFRIRPAQSVQELYLLQAIEEQGVTEGKEHPQSKHDRMTNPCLSPHSQLPCELTRRRQFLGLARQITSLNNVCRGWHHEVLEAVKILFREIWNDYADAANVWVVSGSQWAVKQLSVRSELYFGIDEFRIVQEALLKLASDICICRHQLADLEYLRNGVEALVLYIWQENLNESGNYGMCYAEGFDRHISLEEFLQEHCLRHLPAHYFDLVLGSGSFLSAANANMLFEYDEMLVERLWQRYQKRRANSIQHDRYLMRRLAGF